MAHREPTLTEVVYKEAFRAVRLQNRGLINLSETEKYDLDLIWENWWDCDGWYEGQDVLEERHVNDHYMLYGWLKKRGRRDLARRQRKLGFGRFWDGKK